MLESADIKLNSTLGALHRQILDAMPNMAFLVDEEVRVLEANTAATRELGNDFHLIEQCRSGEVFHCIHSTLSP